MRECDRLKDMLGDLAVGALRGRARTRAEAHVRTCADCRAELAALERTGALLDRVLPESAPDATWEAVRQRLAARPPARPRARLRWAWAAGVLALALVALALFLAQPPRVEQPVIVAAADADEEMQATMEGHLTAVWAAPLSDVAAAGLRMASVENDG